MLLSIPDSPENVQKLHRAIGEVHYKVRDLFPDFGWKAGTEDAGAGVGPHEPSEASVLFSFFACDLRIFGVDSGNRFSYILQETPLIKSRPSSSNGLTKCWTYWSK